MNPIVFENELCVLKIGEDAIAKSVFLKSAGRECLSPAEYVPFFSVEQPRPFNNEIKLAHPNRRTVYPACRLRVESEETGPDGFRRITLAAGFRLAPYEALIEADVAPRYFAFRLKGFRVPPEAYPGLKMDTPPVSAFTLAALPLPALDCFGEWLNVSHDAVSSVALIAGDPTVWAENEAHDTPSGTYRVLTAKVRKETGLYDRPAVLLAAPTDSFLDAMDDAERDLGLPRGAASRRSDALNASTYWTADCTPANVDEHIRFAKEGGFRLMLLYYTSFFRERGYTLNGNYDWRDEYPRGKEDARAMVDKIRAAGITPGLHFLQTHIGLSSRYCTPTADARLNLTRRFTLSEEVGPDAGEIPVDEDPAGSALADGTRILSFGGELISYEGFTSERPFRFTGCERGHRGTAVRSHPKGERGGILDVSEFGAMSCYIDQNTSLQDEIADKIADLYNVGFRFCYFDGSEGAGPPYEIWIPLAQYRVWKKLSPAPLFTEGAAKAHFSWHHLSGGNAFDIFPPDIFKDMIRKYPAEEAPRMRQDFTRLDFGWWGFWLPEGRKDGGTQADLVEFGSSRAAAWDCPVTIQTNLAGFRAHPRIRDILAVFRRWEEVREAKWLTGEQKEMLRDTGREHILLINGEGSFELLPYEQIPTGDPSIRAFFFRRRGKNCVVFWHLYGEGILDLPLPSDCAVTRTEDGDPLPIEREGNRLRIPVGDRLWLSTEAGEEEIRLAFAEGTCE